MKHSAIFTFLVPESCGFELRHLIVTRHSVYVPDSAATLHFSSPPPPGASTLPFSRSSCVCLFFLTASLRARWRTRPYREDATVTHCIVHFACHPRLTAYIPSLCKSALWILPVSILKCQTSQSPTIWFATGNVYRKLTAHPNSDNHGGESIFRNCKLHCLLQNWMVQRKVNNDPQLLPILCQLNPVYSLIPTCSMRWAISLFHNAQDRGYSLLTVSNTYWHCSHPPWCSRDHWEHS